jgi:hypothetical protein
VSGRYHDPFAHNGLVPLPPFFAGHVSNLSVS